jgi:hypothetical protein
MTASAAVNGGGPSLDDVASSRDGDGSVGFST